MNEFELRRPISEEEAYLRYLWWCCVEWPACKECVISALGYRNLGLILDEAHCAKSCYVLRTRRSLALAQSVNYRALLTPIPIINRLVEMISQLNVIGRLDAFGGCSGFIQCYCLGQKNGAARLDELGRL